MGEGSDLFPNLDNYSINKTNSNFKHYLQSNNYHVRTLLKILCYFILFVSLLMNQTKVISERQNHFLYLTPASLSFYMQ